MVPVAYSCVAFLEPAERLSSSVRNNTRLDFQLNTRSARITGTSPGPARA